MIVEETETSTEYRCMGLWIKIASEKSATLNVYGDEKVVSYTKRDDAAHIRLIKTGQLDWTLVVQDLYADKLSGKVILLGIGSEGKNAGGLTIQQLTFGKTESSVRKLLERNKPN